MNSIDNTKQAEDLVKELERVAKKKADVVSVSNGTEQLTYSCLEQSANGIANQIGLLKEVGRVDDSKDFTIGLYFAQTIDVVPAILGTLKSKSVYVPLEVYLPEDRLKTIVEDAKISVILTNNFLLESAKSLVIGKNITVIDVSEIENSTKAPNLAIDPIEPAYIMYTSGSTGQPKGVIQTHENIQFFCAQFVDMLRISSSDRIAMTTSFGHTVSAIDIFSHLLKGATIFMYDVKKERSLFQLRKNFIRDQITIFHSIPNLFRLLFSEVENGLSSIRLIILGGEDVRGKDFDIYKRACPERSVFVNLYGSSELIIGFAQLMNKKTSLTGSRIPIGSPLKGVEFEIQGEKNESKGVLATGELVFKSKYLTPGYWNHETKNLGYINKNDSDVRFYRSGDLGRLLPSGTIEYKGRNDTMLKINGNRIELNEIEISLDSFPAINKSIVKVFEREEEQRFLVCFYTSTVEELQDEVFREYLLNILPNYMIPEMFISLEEFPLTTTGKIDKKSLDIKEFINRQSAEKIEPSSEVEHTVARIWAEVLGHDNFGINDKFFEVGGNSLKLIELHSKLGNEFVANAPSVQVVFDYQTVKTLAFTLDNLGHAEEIREEEVVNDFEF